MLFAIHDDDDFCRCPGITGIVARQSTIDSAAAGPNNMFMLVYIRIHNIIIMIGVGGATDTDNARCTFRAHGISLFGEQRATLRNTELPKQRNVHLRLDHGHESYGCSG